jgi:transcriptional regulator with XRE-family HTH domain
MGRTSFSDSLLTRVRHYFGISQEELARYLGVSGSLLSLLESGQRAFSPEVAEQVAVLEQQLLPANTPLAPADLAAPDPASLEARLDYCRHHTRRLRRALRPLEAQTAYATRWRVALPALRATLPPDPGGEEPPVATGPGRWTAFLGWYRWRWLEQRPTALSPAEAARYHLLRLQAEALETEAAALVVLLQGGNQPPRPAL